MRVGRTSIEDQGYEMEKHLKRTTSEKDVGVIFDDKLRFDDHLAEKVNKANNIVGLIRRNFVSLDTEIFRVLFVTLVRPHIEYANQVWCPHLVKDIVTLENVQRRATKMVPQLKDLTYEERLRELKLPTLAYRRVRGDMIEVYKITSGRYDEECSKGVLQSWQHNTNRGHSHKLFKTRSRLDLRKYSFPCRVVNYWNSLPEWVVTASSVQQFEARLDKFWVNQELVYNYRAQIVQYTPPPNNSTYVDLESQA